MLCEGLRIITSVFEQEFDTSQERIVNVARNAPANLMLANTSR